LDETLFCRLGRLRSQQWCTSIVDVTGGGLIDVVPGKHWTAAAGWLADKPAWWRARVVWGVLDLSGSYAKTFRIVLAHAAQVADPFHVCKLANAMVDDVRRRVQQETLGHRGRKPDPLYRARRLLTKAHERLDQRGNQRLLGLLAAGDPKGEVRDAWHAKETLRGLYDIDDHATAVAFLDQLVEDLKDPALPFEARRLGRTLRSWRVPITNWHASRVTNGPTEAANNLIKRIKRVAFGMTRFAHYRIRVLLYAGKPNWGLLDTVTPR
jgi:transposase